MVDRRFKPARKFSGQYISVLETETDKYSISIICMEYGMGQDYRWLVTIYQLNWPVKIFPWAKTYAEAIQHLKDTNLL